MSQFPPSAAPATSSTEPFRPCFVVGNERSGTTLLTVLLGRHSQLATTPETHFVSLTSRRRKLQNGTHEQLLDQLFASRHTIDMHIDRARVAERFRRLPADYPSLFRSLLEEFIAQHAPGKTRVGEKTPLHLLSVPTLIEWFPHCRIVCIVRDGRDVVLSLQNMPWNNERRLRPLCLDWIRLLRLAEGFTKKYPEHFFLIRYEDLLDRPEQVLREVDAFLGLPFEPQQFNPEVSTANVVPDSEQGWKGQALKELDPSRKATWKKKATAEQLLVMNTLMGPDLRRMGYPETEAPPAPLGARLSNAAANLLFRSGLWTLWHKMIERNLPSARARRRRERSHPAADASSSR